MKYYIWLLQPFWWALFVTQKQTPMDQTTMGIWATKVTMEWKTIHRTIAAMMMMVISLTACQPQIVSCPIITRHSAQDLDQMKREEMNLPQNSKLKEVYKEWFDVREDAAACRYQQRHPGEIRFY